MISPRPQLYGSSNSRRARYSRSPSGDIPPSKRSKPSSSADPYDRNYASEADPHQTYTSICVKRINPKISDMRVRELCDKKFSKYGPHAVKIYRKGNERVAFVNFTNADDARRARQAKTDLVWEGEKVFLDPVFYRKTLSSDRPMSPEMPRERFSSNRRTHRPSPPPVVSRSHSHRQISSRRQRSISPPPLPPPPPPPLPRLSRRAYAPYIPLPPDLADYSDKKASRQRQRSPSASPPVRGGGGGGGGHYHKQTSRQQRSRSPVDRPSSSRRVRVDNEPVVQHEPSRTLFIENLERSITESTLKQIFTRYGTIVELGIKKPSSTSKRASAIIKFKNMDMAYHARQAMDGQLIGETVSKIGYGKTGPTRQLWIENITNGIRRRDLEHTFARYGQIEKFYCSPDDSTAIVTYVDIEDAVKVRKKLNGAIPLNGGQVILNQSDNSTLSRDGLRIDYYDRPATARRTSSRSQQILLNRRESRSLSKTPSHKNSPSPERARSASNHDDAVDQPEENITENLKTETHSRSPTPPVLPPIKQRRSTDESQTPSVPSPSPLAGRTFHGPLGSYLSPDDTADINHINDLMILCEQLNSSATKSNTALSTVYPVQFILKSHAYDARMHFLAGSPTLASLLLGQPGDLVAAKTELRITQRLRLEQQKLDELERKLRANVTNALTVVGNNSYTNANGLVSISSRKQLLVPKQTKFSILIASPKVYSSNKTTNMVKEPTTNGQVKSERASPPRTDENDGHVKVKEERTDEHDESNDEDEPLLSRLISYLAEKEAAGVISIPFYPTYQNDYNHSSKQETAVLHIFPPCEFSKKVLKIICPSIKFSDNSHTPPSRPTAMVNDEHLMVVIIHSE